MKTKLILLPVLIVLTQVSGFPRTVTDSSSYVTSSGKENYRHGEIGPIKSGSSVYPITPEIYEMRIDTNVSNRFAKTLVTSKVRNPGDKAQESVFSVILPKKAFISKFVMLIDGRNYEAYIKEKEEAKQIYDEAVASGLGAAHVATSARDSNRFTVSVNVQPRSKAVFLLTYEELLERRNNQYELVINIHPKQPVDFLHVTVWINESLPIKFVKAPQIRSGNDISDPKGDLDSRAEIKNLSPTSATVTFSPTSQRQKELAKILGTNFEEGLSGQFIVQYEVQRDQSGGEILLEDGYFVHFFAPTQMPTLPKHVLFVLDTSASMYGTKIDQLKEAMSSIIAELKPQDFFHLIEFNTLAQVLEIFDINRSVQYPSREPDYYFVNNFIEEDITQKVFPSSRNADEDNKHRATEIINALKANGGTNIHDALKLALHLVNEDQKYRFDSKLQPLIIFLTDGDATVGITHTNKIVNRISDLNIHAVPIFSLSFGHGANRELLQKLSLRNYGFSRHIYEAADAALQLEDFYKQISSPLLKNVKFKYTEDATMRITKTDFPLHFDGSELVVSGIIAKEFSIIPKISGLGIDGPMDFIPIIRQPVAPLERLWAYLTIQQLLDDREISEDKYNYDQKILDLALNYSFVTPVSSLVVVKPNSSDSSVAPEAADKGSDAGNTYASAPSLSALGSPPAGALPLPQARDETFEYDEVDSFYEEEHLTTLIPEGITIEKSSTEEMPSSPESLYLTTPGPERTSKASFEATQSTGSPEIETASRPVIETTSSTIRSEITRPADGPEAMKPETAVASRATTETIPSTTRTGVTSKTSFPTTRSEVSRPTDSPEKIKPEATYKPEKSEFHTASSTTFRPLITIPRDIEALKRNLPWLENFLIKDNFIRTSQGDLKLDVNATSTDSVTCPNSLTNGEGFCKYLHECWEVHSLLTNVHIFQQYYCQLNGFAAICCPPKHHFKSG